MGERLNEIETSNRMLTVRDLAVYLRLSQAVVYKLARAGQVPALRVGKSWRFKKELIDDWIQRQAGQHGMELQAAEGRKD